MRSGLFVVLASSALLLGCPLSSQSKPARMQEAAQELNLNTRFGRMELAAEHVSPKARAAFFDRRKGWGGTVRIADWELAGMRLDGDSDAETTVRIAWYRSNEGDLKVTTLKQKWHDFKGDWKLTDETRIDGEIGLLGEPPPPAADQAPKRTQFPTIKLGGAAAPPSGDPPRLDD